MARKVFGSPRKRAVVALLLAGAVIGALFVGNAGAHFTTNTQHLGKHAWQQFIKQKADKRYLRQTKTWVGEGFLNGGDGQNATTQVNCPNGWEALGGGVHFVSNNPDDVDVIWNGPMIAGDNIVAAPPGKNPAATGWKVVLSNDGVSGHNYSVAVICSRAA